jgi:hypothetical protein
VGDDPARLVISDQKGRALDPDMPGQRVGCVPFRVQGIDAVAAKQRFVSRAPRPFEEVVDRIDVIEIREADALRILLGTGRPAFILGYLTS